AQDPSTQPFGGASLSSTSATRQVGDRASMRSVCRAAPRWAALLNHSCRNNTCLKGPIVAPTNDGKPKQYGKSHPAGLWGSDAFLIVAGGRCPQALHLFRS